MAELIDQSISATFNRLFLLVKKPCPTFFGLACALLIGNESRDNMVEKHNFLPMKEEMRDVSAKG